MAFGILCKNCGWQETDHQEVSDDEGVGDVVEGCTHSLVDCPGYHPEDEAEHGRLRDQEVDAEIVRLNRGIGSLPI